MSQNRKFSFLPYAITAVVFAYCGYSIFSSLQIEDDTVKKGSDTSQYLRFSRNLIDGKGFSSVWSDLEPIKPTAHREPGWPTIMTIAYWLSPQLRSLPLPQFRSLVYSDEGAATWEENKHYLQPFLVLNGSLLLLTVIICAAVVKAETKKFWAAWLVMILIASHSSLLANGSRLLVETSYMSLLGLSSALGYAAAKSRNYAIFAATGLSFGALILTRATFLYMLPLALLASPLIIWRASSQRRQLALGYYLMLGLAFALPALWMYRNQQLFGYFDLRSSNVLAVRASYLEMTPSEYKQSFIHWTPVIDEEDWLPDIENSRFNRRNPNGFYRVGKDLRVDSVRQRYPDANEFEISEIVTGEALRDIFSQPFWYTASLIPFTYKGFFVDRWISKSLVGILIVNLVEHFALLGLIYISWRRRKIEILFLLLPATFLLAFHAVFTHNIGRFNFPAIPIIYCATVIGLGNEVVPRIASVVKRKST